MDIALFGRALVLGFAVAAAVGPISLLTIRRTLTEGLRVGLASGAGVATADAAYAGVAAFGLTAVSDLLVGQARWLEVVGGAFLVFLGFRTVLSRPTAPAASPSSRGITAAYASIVVLTLANPMTILSFAALFVGLGVMGHGEAGAALLVAGVFLGSMAWWVALTFTVSRLRAHVSPDVLRLITLASGFLIVTFGAVAILAGLRGP
jgi:threonine/homoserine/homoserine lactone efflux protein